MRQDLLFAGNAGDCSRALVKNVPLEPSTTAYCPCSTIRRSRYNKKGNNTDQLLQY